MVGILAGALGSGLGQAAEATAKLGRDFIDDERKVDVYRQMSEVDVMKQDRIDELKKARDYEYKVKESNPDGDIASNERENKKRGITDLYSDKSVLKALADKDIAETAGDRSVKAMRSGDSVASEGALGKLDGKTKALVSMYSKELDTISGAIVKAQADGTWSVDSDNAKALLRRQSDLTSKVNGLLSVEAPSGSGRSAADFDSSNNNKPSHQDVATAAVVAGDVAPQMDLSTRRAYTAQGKQGAIQTIESRIAQYQKAQADNPTEDLGYGPTIQKLRDQIRAVQVMK